MFDLKKIEEEILLYWKINQIYQKVKQKNLAEKKFFFCDGPPYATGQIHPGTAWNKCLKDSILRYFRANGYDVLDKPGYDTHGLPIEVKVEKELNIEDKKEIEKYGLEKFVKKCKEFATKHIDIITSQFQRCGVWMDWSNPYITYENYYIESIWKTIKAAEEKGLLKEGYYVVPYSPDSQTSLANYELEYHDREDPSIFVRFKLKGKTNEYFLIWTTTPWTLIANLAIMVHPTYNYIKVKIDEDFYYIAQEREHILKEIFKDKNYQVVGSTTGKKLEGIEYIHPLEEKLAVKFDRKVILSDEFVTLEEGTGLVHTAPGHGPEDFKACKPYKIEPFCPVDTKGQYTADAGAYAGLKVLEANEKIIQDLENANALVYKTTIIHRYPHDWRKKTPLIYITTHQWFISISDLKEKMLEEIDKNINFHPEFARTRFRDFVKSAPDWCISRQRFWGAPLPIWICQNCSKRKVVGSIKELGVHSIDLHRPYIDKIELICPECNGKMKRIPDILDVWFDSGNAMWAQFREEEKQKLNFSEYICDFIIEGKDQTRGWFYSLLGSSMILYDKTCYKNLTMHGFFVDEKGEKMSKSIGNYVPLEEILDRYGADAFRLWGLSSTIWDDLKFSWTALEESKRVLEIILNIGIWLERFYKPVQNSSELNFEIEDIWLRSKMQKVIEAVTNSFENFEPHGGLVILKNFLVEDISRFYLKKIKSRIVENKNADAALLTIYECFFNSLKLLSPYCPFVSEYLYLKVFKQYEKLESISLFEWPKVNNSLKNNRIENEMEIAIKIIGAIAHARLKANLKLRWPIKKVLVCSESLSVKQAIQTTSQIIKSMANCFELEFSCPPSTYNVLINNAAIGAKFKGESPKIISALKQMDSKTIVEKLNSNSLKIDEKYEIDKTMVQIQEVLSGYSIAEFDGGKVYVSCLMDIELYSKALLKEVIRRIQQMRKELNLVNTDKINCQLEGDEELVKLSYDNKEQIQKITNSALVEKIESFDLSKDWEIEDKKIIIKIKKI
ncbi:MAG: isoleucine--tRNA ligase [Candidatus Micrarchaeota archaeon]|nr:isoleucine--tRNA ligase [Candidatus Micrarchaeota archaeon]